MKKQHLGDSRNSNLHLHEYISHNGPLPFDKDIEQTVIGGIALDTTVMKRVARKLNENCFHEPAYRVIYKSMLLLFKEGKKIDIMTIINKLRETGYLEVAGGAYGVSQITNRIASTAHIDEHCLILIEYSMRRQQIELARNTLRSAYDLTESTLVTQEAIHRAYVNINKGMGINSPSLTEIIEVLNVELEDMTELIVIPTPFRAVNKITGGLMKTNLDLIGARPGMGKTSYIIALAKFVAFTLKKKLLIFSLEMTAKQLIRRMAAMDCKINVDRVMRNNLTSAEKIAIKKAMAFYNDNLIIEDIAPMSMEQLRALTYYHVHENGVEVIMIDYLQRITLPEGFGNKNRDEKIGNMSTDLKNLAKELNINVTALSQLSRESEKRKDNVPQLSDLRESGNLEQDADTVIFLYRPEYYNLKKDKEGNSLEEVCYAIVAKQRNGAIGNAKLRFKGRYTEFSDWDDEQQDNVIPIEFEEETPF